MPRRVAFAGPCFNGFPFFFKDDPGSGMRIDMTHEQLFGLFWRVKTFTSNISVLSGSLTMPGSSHPFNPIDFVLPFTFDFANPSIVSPATDELAILTSQPRFSGTANVVNPDYDGGDSVKYMCPQTGGFGCQILGWQPPLDNSGAITKSGAAKAGNTYYPDWGVSAGCEFSLGIYAGPYALGSLFLDLYALQGDDGTTPPHAQEVGTFSMVIGSKTWTARILAKGRIPQQSYNPDPNSPETVTPPDEPIPDVWTLQIDPFNVTLTATEWWPYNGKDGGAIWNTSTGALLGGRDPLKS